MKSLPHSSELPGIRTSKKTSRKKRAKSFRSRGKPKTIAGSELVLGNAESSKTKNAVPGKDSRNRRNEALRRLGVKAEQLVNVPQISHILKHAERGLPQVIDALRGYDEEDAQAFIQKYDSLSLSDQKHLTIEDICVAAEIRTLDLLASATKALVLESQTASAIIAATSHYKVVRKTVAMANTDGGHRDREMIHLATGFLPSPKGSTFINQRVQVANFGGDKQHPTANPAPPPDEEDLISMDDDLVAMDQFERKMLPAGK